MPLPKNRKPITAQVVTVHTGPAVDTGGAPVRIVVLSDGNELEYRHHNGDAVVYQYTKSNTKLGAMVSFSWENLDKFVYRNGGGRVFQGDCNLVAKKSKGKSLK